MENLRHISACILTGGQGTRLKDVLPSLPKGLAPVSGRPFLSFILEQLRANGVRRTILCTGYMGDAIRGCFGPFYGDMELVYSHEAEPLDTGGALRLAVPHMDTDTVLVLNGDTYAHTDLLAFATSFDRRLRRAQILLVHKEDTARYGRITLDPDDAVTAFAEKGVAGPGWISAGIYLMDRDVVRDIPESKPVSVEKTVFPSLIGHGLFAVRTNGAMIDIGTKESYQKAEFFLSGFGGISVLS